MSHLRRRTGPAPRGQTATGSHAACHPPQLYDATLVCDAHTTEDMREWGFPVAPETSIAYTNAY